MPSQPTGITLADLEFEEGTINMGGTAGVVYIIPASKVKSITPPAAGTLSTAVIEFKTGYCMSSLYMTADTGRVKDVEVGEKDAGSFNTQAEWWTPRINDSLLVTKSKLANGGFILVIKDGNGVMRIIGSKDHPAYRTPGEVDTGAAPKDKNGATFKVEAASPTPALIYTGTEEALRTPGV